MRFVVSDKKIFEISPNETHHWTWRPCWISDRHQNNKFCRGPSSDHPCQVWFQSSKRFQRRRSKCEKFTDRQTTDDGRKVMTIAHMVLRTRWANKNIYFLFTTKMHFHSFWKTERKKSRCSFKISKTTYIGCYNGKKIQIKMQVKSQE